MLENRKYIFLGYIDSSVAYNTQELIIPLYLTLMKPELEDCAILDTTFFKKI